LTIFAGGTYKAPVLQRVLASPRCITTEPLTLRKTRHWLNPRSISKIFLWLSRTPCVIVYGNIRRRLSSGSAAIKNSRPLSVIQRYPQICFESQQDLQLLTRYTSRENNNCVGRWPYSQTHKEVDGLSLTGK